MIADTDERFWSKVDKTGECWEWTARRYRGYGRYRFEGKNQLAHRLVMGLRQGDPRFALHHCDNPGCVNPDHLYVGDHKANMADATRRSRWGRRTGSASGRSVDKPATILWIREQHRDGRTTKEIAVELGRSPSWVWRICAGERWPDGPWPNTMNKTEHKENPHETEPE